MRQPYPGYWGDAMKVVVDLKLCEGNQRCMEAAPEVFEVGNDDQARVLNVNPPAALHEKVRLAARMCPRQAITLEE
jgi:ferredoxin